ncbi:MAG: hypothetical protein WAT12_05770 [Candidatus Nitrotoga sp.]
MRVERLKVFADGYNVRESILKQTRFQEFVSAVKLGSNKFVRRVIPSGRKCPEGCNRVIRLNGHFVNAIQLLILPVVGRTGTVRCITVLERIEPADVVLDIFPEFDFYGE